MPTKLQLFINDQPADLSDNTPIALTFQVNDLADLKDRQSTFSNSLKLPLTANNRNIFGQAQAAAFTQNQPYTILTAKYISEGIEVLPYGQFRLESVGTTLNGNLYSGLTGFVDRLKTPVIDRVTGKIKSYDDSKLVDLDWSDIPNFSYNLETIVASQTTRSPLWAIIDYGGTLDPLSLAYTQYLRPGITFQQIFDHIAKFTGYTFTGGAAFTAGLSDYIPLSDNDLYNYEGEKWTDTRIPLSVAKNLPDLTVKDVLKDYMQRYFLTPLVDNVRQVIYFMNFDEVYLNKYRAKNWTKKFVQGGNSDTFTLGKYAQANNLLWVADNASNNGTGLFTVNNQTLDLNTDLITSIFAASDNVTTFGGNTIASIKKFDASPLPNTGARFEVETKPRVVRLNQIRGAYQITDTNATRNVDAPYVGVFNDWDYYLYNYGKGLLRLLNKVRVCTRMVVLNELDVQNFDFRVPVYDEREACYYYVNTIKQWQPGKPCSVDLIRM